MRAALSVGVLVGLGLIAAGCAAQKVACQIIRTADDACTLIEYLGDDGKVHQEPVSAGDLRQMAKRSAAKRAAAGADAGAK